jgi:hypothetical protein
MTDPEKPEVDRLSLPASDVTSAGEEQLREHIPADDVPPNGGYGWICVACTFGIMSQSWGLNAVSSTFSPIRLTRF